MDNKKPLSLVIFGITSNLAQKYSLHALYDMQQKGILPENIQIIGNARRPLNKEEFADFVQDSLNSRNVHHPHSIDNQVLEQLINKIDYLQGNFDDPNFYLMLKQLIKNPNIIFYLATLPDLYRNIFENLKLTGLDSSLRGWVRIMVEKPFGIDLKSAKELNKLLLNYFKEEQIFRLDHYLGKETLQNILTFRFGNNIFEPLINHKYIDHIQITAAEDYGVGMRGSYYDQVGALKDVGQNHQLQMLAFATMEAPEQFTNEAITAQRLKILTALKPLKDKIVFGQYQGYQSEPNVNPNSQTETFYAYKTFIDNNKFKDIPIYVRAGKMLKQLATEVSIVFKNPVKNLFVSHNLGFEPNILIYRIQPNEGIVLKIVTKKPGHKVELEPEYMQFCYKLDHHSHYIPDPYEKLLIDTISGDQTFFNSAEEVEAQWAFIDSLISQKPQIELYEQGSWGPKAAIELIEADGRTWLEPSMDFCKV